MINKEKQDVQTRKRKNIKIVLRPYECNGNESQCASCTLYRYCKCGEVG